ncbi:MAG: thioredoxin-dependent thiol peroxidase [Oleispira antarctica]|uniref:thioredoxin-dependent peroxiredoxin n=1 Tax=Oleispira antarctica RB-8 TaxID=698738 RepID=R4YLC1_OLEAN|nr:thioredoxin-dependent thiol peroxidase [Oleispira antarctica]MBQ0792496.1 thioredoxin-dependent thiol peroxidase [Oleispira antarctica]CCK75432.1 Bacterioferritin comigratory protein [Oleispira antarctica RB-8]|tara:strand:- start:390 stop:863 length:474 start_codon:yes stop_codon:yes gene_type:complete
MSLTFPPLDQIAPQFTTTDQNGEEVSLSDFKGKKVVLYFYPKASTPGCTVQACGIRDNKEAFVKANTVVLGISPDPTKRLTNFTTKQELNFPLLSDENNSIAESYGVWALKKFMGKEYIGIHRVTFIIDEEGILRHVMAKVKTKSHHDDVLDIINTL